ncbi:hypothetical protein NIES2130_27985 [Scytonema sp. HK-05]|nr:hypothetical protein NIES2130_27985 [Scytonema sp. HK-05]
MNIHLLKNFMETQSVAQIPYISYQNLCKSSKVMKGIFKVFFPTYNLSFDDFFNYYPLLGFIEALVYQTDVEVEAAQANRSSMSPFSLWNRKKELIQSLLKELNLEHPTIEDALEKMGEFFDLESQVMAADTITHADITRLSELRSGDIRVLHHTLIQMLGKPHRPEVFELFLPLEVISEFADDIISYKKDVASGHYNTYWMFERLYGEEAPYYLKAEIDRYLNLYEEKLKLFSKNEYSINLEEFSKAFNNMLNKFSFLSNANLICTTALKGFQI